jgi:hypothetical protein
MGGQDFICLMISVPKAEVDNKVAFCISGGSRR